MLVGLKTGLLRDFYHPTFGAHLTSAWKHVMKEKKNREMNHTKCIIEGLGASRQAAPFIPQLDHKAWQKHYKVLTQEHTNI